MLAPDLDALTPLYVAPEPSKDRRFNAVTDDDVVHAPTAKCEKDDCWVKQASRQWMESPEPSMCVCG